VGVDLTADQMFTEVFNRFLNGWAEVWALREVAESGIPAAKPVVLQKKRILMEYWLRSGQWNKMVKNPEEVQLRGGISGISQQMTMISLQSAAYAVDAASLVFGHSITDAAPAGFLRVTSLACPRDWEQFLDKKKVTVAEVRDHRYESLFKGLLLEELDNIERNTSLPRKAERLNQLCRPEPDWILPVKYQEGEVMRIDKMRHDIIHGDSLGTPLETVSQDLELLHDLGRYFLVIVNNRYGTRLL
jgi:hypothetical protein